MDKEAQRCRLCLSEEILKENILEKKDDQGIDIGTKIVLCTSLMVSNEDSYPKYVCSHCLNMIELFFDFRSTCLKAYMTIHNTMQSVTQMEDTFLIQVIDSDKESVEKLSNQDENDKDLSIAEKFKPIFFDEKELEVDGKFVEDLESNKSIPRDGRRYNIINTDKRNITETKKREGCGGETIVDIDPEELYLDRQFQVGCYVSVGEQNQNSDGGNLFRRYKCVMCKKVFSSITELDAHWDLCGNQEESVDPNSEYNSIAEPLEGPQSDEIFVEDDEVIEMTTSEFVQSPPKCKASRKQKVGYKEFCCETCGQIFKQLPRLKRHIQVKHIQIKPFNCPNCPRSFYDKYELKYHQRLHQDVEDFCCNICGRRFARRSGLKDHMRSHTGEKPFSCSLCCKNFSHFNSLISHERVHTGERPFGCRYCDRTFTQYSTAKSHEDMHMDGERMYQCDTCDRMYRTEPELKSHNALHLGILMFRCEICEKGFKKQVQLDKHNRRLHCDTKPFPCSNCEKSFVTIKELKLHDMTHTGEFPYPCIYCGKSYRLKSTLRRHVYKHHRFCSS